MHRNICIRVGLEELTENESIVNAIKQAILTIDGLNICGLKDDDLKKVHLGLLIFSFHAYSGFRWQNESNGVKEYLNDKSNLAMPLLTC